MKDLQWDASVSRWMVTVVAPGFGDVAAARMLMFRADGTFDAQVGTDYTWTSAGGVTAGVRIPGVDNWYLWSPGGSDYFITNASGQSISLYPDTTGLMTQGAGTLSMCYDGSNLIAAHNYYDGDSTYAKLDKFTTSALAGANLIANPGFEANTTNWYLSTGSCTRITGANVISGAGSLQIVGSANTVTNVAWQPSTGSPTPIPKVKYSLTFKCKQIAGTPGVVQGELLFYNGSTFTTTTVSFNPTATAQTFTVSLVAPPDAKYISMNLTFPKGTANTFVLDDVTMGTAAGLNYVGTDTLSTPSGLLPTSGIYVGSGDFGSKTYVIVTQANGNTIVVPDSTKAESFTLDFPLPAVTPVGIGYDGTAFWTLGSNHVLYKHEPGNKFTTESPTWWAASSWQDTTNSYETTLSPQVSFTMKSRARLTITTAPFLTGTGTDPNGIGVYLARQTSAPSSGQLHYQGTAPTNSKVITTATFSGVAPPALPGVFTLGTPAEIASAALAVDGSGKPMIDLKGDGSGRVGPLVWDSGGGVVNSPVPVGTIQMYAGATEPTGWKFCQGLSVPVGAVGSTYYSLFQVIQYKFGGSGASFNLPNFTDMFPIGASGTKALGTNGGNATKVIQPTNLTSHTHDDSHNHTPATVGYQYTATTATGGSALRVTDIANQTGGGGTAASFDAATRAWAGSTDGGPGTSAAMDVMNPWRAVNFIIKL